MTYASHEFFLFVGSTDSEAATTRLRANGGFYRKKLLNSRPENWLDIAAMIASPQNRGTLVALTGNDYQNMCRPEYEEAAREVLDSLRGRPHLVFVHEAVFLTDEQRAASDSEQVDRATQADVTPRLTDDDYYGMTKEEFFGSVPEDVRQRVNRMLRERELEVIPYRTNAERSIVASTFIEDNERRLLFRVYVPSGRLYAQEAEALLGLFREWLVQTGRGGIRQEGYTTSAGQVFEFFSAEGETEGGLTQDLEDFSSFLESCVSAPETAAGQLTAFGVDEAGATLIVSRFATRARRLSLDLRQRREERILSLKHHLENVILEVDGLTGDALTTMLEELIPAASAQAVIEGPMATASNSLTLNFSPQLISHVAGSVVQNVGGTVNLGPEAHQLLELVATFGGVERMQLETAVHELEDEGARGADRIAARGRLKRFLADLGNRGVGVGLNVVQKYVEHKLGVS